MTCFSQYPLIKSSCHDCNIFHITVHYWKVLVRLHNWSNTHTCKAKTFLDTSVLGVYIKILVVRRYWYPEDEWMVICDLPQRGPAPRSSSLNNMTLIQEDFKGTQEKNLLQGLVEEMTKNMMCPLEGRDTTGFFCRGQKSEQLGWGSHV